ncbi:MAG: hypothetical protein ACLP7O_08200 [Terracidiphilus sp.]
MEIEKVGLEADTFVGMQGDKQPDRLQICKKILLQIDITTMIGALEVSQFEQKKEK